MQSLHDVAEEVARTGNCTDHQGVSFARVLLELERYLGMCPVPKPLGVPTECKETQHIVDRCLVLFDQPIPVPIHG